MTIVNPERPGLGLRPELTPEQEARNKLNPTLSRLGLVSTLPNSGKLQQALTEQATKEWAEQARPGVRRTLPQAQEALKGVSDLPDSARARWTGRMSILVDLASPPREDAVAIIRYLNAEGRELRDLQELALTFSAQQMLAVQRIVNTFEAFRKNIGTLHPNIQYTDRFANFNPDHTRRESNMLRTALFLVAIGGAMVSGTLAFLKRNDDPNRTLPMVYLGVAALALGWGDLTRNGTESLGRQIGWLTTPGDWDVLQNQYAIRGPLWATFTRSLYEARANHPVAAVAMVSPNPITPAQRKAVMDITPGDIQTKVGEMLDSVGPPKGKDFKTFAGLLNRAVTPDSRNIVLAYLQSGTNRQSLALLAEQPGTQDKVKKAGGLGAPPTPTV